VKQTSFKHTSINKLVLNFSRRNQISEFSNILSCLPFSSLDLIGALQVYILLALIELLIQITQLHASYINRQDGHEKNHLHEKIYEQPNIGKYTKLLNGWNHRKETKAYNDQLKAQNLGD